MLYKTFKMYVMLTRKMYLVFNSGDITAIQYDEAAATLLTSS